MGVEIERKFLLRDNSWQAQADQGTHFRQGYLSSAGPGSVRVRIEGEQAKLNIKSATLDMHRLEYEYPIPLADAHQMLDQICIKPLIDKIRYHVMHAGKLWEIDVFSGDNQGLVVAEVELRSRDEQIDLPDWAGAEVTHDKRYYNVSLVRHPYRDW